MQYGLCPLSVVPLRATATDSGEMVSQILYGEHFKVLEKRKVWSRVRLSFDGLEGWVLNNQIQVVTQELYNKVDNEENPSFAADLVSFVEADASTLIPIVIGSAIHSAAILGHHFEGTVANSKMEKSHLLNTAALYLNTPYLKGGKTPFGLDCSGFTQMVYKLNGYQLKRSALDQSSQGDALSFIEESEPGDLAFFDNSEGLIDHVGIIMKDNYIIHTHGKVRIDRIDHTGIFNTETRGYTHTLRVIKKII